MNQAAPVVSVLISTYNRSHLLRRAIESVLMQSFGDFELVIVDDCSKDDTPQVVAWYNDSRIRYIRNETNIGAKEGDRAHLRRFVYELARGRYFVYLCDDDYWLSPTLLQRQVTAFKLDDNLAMVIGGQLSYFLMTPDSYLGHSPGNPMRFSLDNLGSYFDLVNLVCKSPHFYFHEGSNPGRSLYRTGHMTSNDFLKEFSDMPTSKNIIGGATLYSRANFVKSGALALPKGSQWQAGYELMLGPGCYGNVVYLNEPAILAEIRPTNASFQRTQAEHYLDAVVSVERAFVVPLADKELRARRDFLMHIRAKTIRNLSRAFLNNTITIRQQGQLGMCSTDNMSRPVTGYQVLPALVRNAGLRTLTWPDVKLLAATLLPDAIYRQLIKAT